MLKLKLQHFGYLIQRTDSLGKKTCCWERLKAGREGDKRGWDGWMASLTRWTWVLAGSRSWWWTGKPGVLQSMGSQRVRHDWATELNWTDKVEAQVSLLWTKARRRQWLQVICIQRGNFIRQNQWARGLGTEQWMRQSPYPHKTCDLAERARQ